MEGSDFGENYKFRKHKKKIYSLIAVVLIILFTSYFLLYAGTNHDILSGYIGSYKVVNKTIILGNQKIVFMNNSYDKLVELYKSNFGREVKGCLKGNYSKEAIYITQLGLPKIYEQKFDSVTALPCPNGTLIAFHTHPNNICLPSAQDFKVAEELNESFYEAVMCSVDRFYFYR